MPISAQPDYAKRCNAQRAAVKFLTELGFPDPRSATEDRDFTVSRIPSGRWIFRTLWRPPAVSRSALRQNLGDSIAQAAHQG